MNLIEIEERIPIILEDVHKGLYSRALKNLKDNTRPVKTLTEASDIINKLGGFIKAMWCGSLECELKMKENAGVSSRCIPFEQECVGDACAVCGKPAEKMVIWGIAY